MKKIFRRDPQSPKSAEKPSAANPKQTETAAERKKADTLAALEVQLQRLVEANGATTAGQFQILVLDEIRERMGDKWDLICGQVNLVVEKIIKSYTGPRDIFYAHGELKYLLIFADLTPADAAQACGTIREEIHDALFGTLPARSTGAATLAREDVTVVTAMAAVPDDLDPPPAESGGSLTGGLMQTLQTLQTLSQKDAAAARTRAPGSKPAAPKTKAAAPEPPRRGPVRCPRTRPRPGSPARSAKRR